jgi:hypothetical protein
MNLNPNLKSSIAWENKTNIGGFQVQNVIFLDCPTMIASDFCARSYSHFKFGLLMFQLKSENVCYIKVAPKVYGSSVSFFVSL